MSNEIPTQKNIFDLIEKITPYNNLYRDTVKSGKNGADILGLMWKVGEIIRIFLNKFDIKPHDLYWRVYGKAEGLKTSYITRDFLSYCLRIRNYFPNLESISKTYSHLDRYSLFREAFPLLENPKYKLSKDEELRIIEMLNSNAEPRKIKNLIKSMKSERIGIKNTRTQRLTEMKPITVNFVAIYDEIYNIIKDNDESLLGKIAFSLPRDYLNVLSQAVSSLTQENLYVPELENKQNIPEQWKLFVSNLQYLLGSSVETRNRFRRLVPPRKLFNLADMLNALTTERGVTNYRKRKSINS